MKSNLGGGIFLTFTLWVRPLTALPSTKVLKTTSPLLFGVKYKLLKSDDKEHFKITRSGDIAFLRLPDYENPVDRNKDNVYNFSYRAFAIKDDKLFVDGEVIVKVKDAEETEVITLDKRKFVSWTVDHQPYHILMEDAVLNYMKLRYSDAGDGESVDEGDRNSIKACKLAFVEKRLSILTLA